MRTLAVSLFPKLERDNLLPHPAPWGVDCSILLAKFKELSQ